MQTLEGALIPPFQRPASQVAIRRAASYEADLFELAYETLREFAEREETEQKGKKTGEISAAKTSRFLMSARGKTVLLKPNFVGLDLLGCMNTHPAVITAVREAFLKLGAERVLIAEGPSMDRDTEAVLESVRLREYTGRLNGDFVDLNIDDVVRVPLRTRASKLKELYFPKTVLGADFVVSMPKLKTHHWAGVTLSLKNMFGIVPGGCYGWPKNVLHWAGIDNSILDINAAVRPDFAIVDGITAMEGNGPIQGKPKQANVLIFGNDPVAVDATCCRIMGLWPEKVKYLAAAGTLLGHLAAEKIEQVGEPIADVRTPFEVLKEFEGITRRQK
ncbi:MAG TPA: DUF362 domain-containing protein [Candidatus Acidoferrales bacterium]|nr:DUF362 domain-containing protein [Candidatus Acidoferrales bacterium]